MEKCGCSHLTIKNNAAFLFIGSLLLIGQINNKLFSQSDSSKFSDDIDIMTCGITYYPEYPGGDAAIRKFFAKNMRYPKTALKDRAGGKVVIEFAIDTFGNTTNINIVKSARNDFDQEAIRIVRLLKGWKFSPDAKGRKRMGYRRQPFTFKMPKSIISKRIKNKSKKKIVAANKKNTI